MAVVSGIGRATAHRLAAEGAKVMLADRSDGPAGEVVKEIIAAGGTAAQVHCDVGVPELIKGAVQAAIDQWGQLDVVVSNAAMMTFTKIIDLDPKDWEQVSERKPAGTFPFYQVCAATPEKRCYHSRLLGSCAPNHRQCNSLRFL